MNNDYATNIHSCSGSDNNRNGDGNGNLNQISQAWGTWEELLLTCAVKRHGSKDWDAVAKEVVSRSSLKASAPSCRLKYQDLKRRFQDSVNDYDGRGNNEAVTEAEEDIDGEVPWLEQLRSLRVAELRRDVQRCDESILSLQLKVKKLEAENDGDDKPDLEDDSKIVRSLPSMNESNSTASVDEIADHERLAVHANDNSRNSDPDHKAVEAAEEEDERTVSRRSGMSHSSELGESGTSTGRRKRKGNIYGGSGDNIEPGIKSQPLIEIVKLIRSHPRGSVFESPLKSQETKDYKSLIRQHLDIKTIEKKLEKGSYVSSSLSFYRDLMLLFTNAIVFFPASSSEYVAAQELRTLVSDEIKKDTGKSSHPLIKSEDGSLVSKQKSSAPPLVICKKKSSVLKTTLPSSSSFKQKDEKKSQEVSEDKAVTTTITRSLSRTSKAIDVVAKDTKMGRAKNNNKKQTDSSNDDDDDDDKEETPKTLKKISSEKKKSVVEFLKRIKNNSPQKGKETTSKDQKKSDGNVKKENSKAKPRELRSNSTGKKRVEVENTSNKSSSKRKQSKKEPEEKTTAGRGKRGRESGSGNQQPKKRSRR